MVTNELIEKVQWIQEQPEETRAMAGRTPAKISRREFLKLFGVAGLATVYHLSWLKMEDGKMRFYVSPSGADKNDGGLERPFKTIGKGLSTAQAGDTLVLRGGTYRERIIVGKSVSLTAFEGEAPIIDGTNIGFSDGRGLLTVTASDVRLSGLTVNNSVYAAIYAKAANNIIVENCRTSNSGSSGIGIWDSSNVRVGNNKVIDAVNVDPSVMDEECISIARCNGFSVYGNEVTFVTRTGVVCACGICAKESSTNGLIYENTLRNIEGSAGLYVDAWNNTLSKVSIYGNKVENALCGISVGAEDNGVIDGVDIYNNVISQVGYAGIHLNVAHSGSSGIYGWRKNVRIINNTIHGSWDNGGAGIFVETEKVSGIVIRNNIVWLSGYNGQIRAVASAKSGIVADHNLVFGSNSYPNEELPGSTRVDPMFVNAAGNDFHLQAGSPAISAGNPSGAPSEDFDGKDRGSTVDVGAFQRQSKIMLPIIMRAVPQG
jgi:hypothetical protein